MEKIFITRNELKTLRVSLLKKSLREIEALSRGKLKAATLHSYENQTRTLPLEKVITILNLYFEIFKNNEEKDYISIPVILTYVDKAFYKSLYKIDSDFTKSIKAIAEHPINVKRFENVEYSELIKFIKYTSERYQKISKIFNKVAKRVEKYANIITTELNNFSEEVDSNSNDINHIYKLMENNFKKEVKTNGKRSGSKKKKR